MVCERLAHPSVACTDVALAFDEYNDATVERVGRACCARQRLFGFFTVPHKSRRKKGYFEPLCILPRFPPRLWSAFT